MLIRAKAPLRISFAGGGTDVPPFPGREGGLVLNATINRYAYGTLRPRADAAITIHSHDYGASVELAPGDVPVFDGKLDLAKDST
jgi:D-glycero-alpha-D-manno-heptose-7-phosphate kinase